MASSFRSFCSLLHTEAAPICKSALAKFGMFFQQVIRHLRALNELMRGFACRVTFDFPIYWRPWNGFPDRLAFHGGTPERMETSQAHRSTPRSLFPAWLAVTKVTDACDTTRRHLIRLCAHDHCGG
jgi:hypothetical protein